MKINELVSIQLLRHHEDSASQSRALGVRPPRAGGPAAGAAHPGLHRRRAFGGTRGVSLLRGRPALVVLRLAVAGGRARVGDARRLLALDRRRPPAVVPRGVVRQRRFDPGPVLAAVRRQRLHRGLVLGGRLSNNAHLTLGLLALTY